MKFEPGSQTMTCPYCGSAVTIPASEIAIQELDFKTHLTQAGREQATYEVLTTQCGSCNAEITFDPKRTASECPFCGISLVRTDHSKRIIKPQSLIPFKVPRDQAQQQFRDWLSTLWFAPNDLKRRAKSDTSLQGIYTPYWTYDAQTTTTYRGQRGEYYYVTEDYTTEENGRQVTKTRQVRKTRWHPTKGRVKVGFDDIPVVASDSLPEAYVDHLQPWDFQELVAYQDDYLSGFHSESYSVDLAAGYDRAIQVMADQITHAINADIGGDTQRIDHQQTEYRNITFKHILLPIWISAYRYNEQIYRFIINGQTGEVQGERPYSWWKIALAIIFAVICTLIVAAGLGIITLPIAPIAWPILLGLFGLFLMGGVIYFVFYMNRTEETSDP